MNSGFSTNIEILFLKRIGRFPFRITYLLFDAFYIVEYYAVAYRKKIAAQNLRNSFPKKNMRELKNISKKYLRHFCDLALVSVKMHKMKKKDFRRILLAERWKKPVSVSKRFDQPIFFQRLEKTRQEKYETTFELLFEDPTKISEVDIINTDKKKEDAIHKKPEFYLWLHRRWKHTWSANLHIQQSNLKNNLSE